LKIYEIKKAKTGSTPSIEKMDEEFLINDFSDWDLDKIIDDSIVNYIQNGQYLYFFCIEKDMDKGDGFLFKLT